MGHIKSVVHYAVTIVKIRTLLIDVRAEVVKIVRIVLRNQTLRRQPQAFQRAHQTSFMRFAGTSATVSPTKDRRMLYVRLGEHTHTYTFVYEIY